MNFLTGEHVEAWSLTKTVIDADLLGAVALDENQAPLTLVLDVCRERCASQSHNSCAGLLDDELLEMAVPTSSPSSTRAWLGLNSGARVCVCQNTCLRTPNVWLAIMWWCILADPLEHQQHINFKETPPFIFTLSQTHLTNRDEHRCA